MGQDVDRDKLKQLSTVVTMCSENAFDLSDYVLFDADEMSYEEILHQLVLRSDENIKLATFTKDIGKVITDRDVMDKDEFGYL